ncbi:inositol 1,4,5-triphosphate receptor associated 1 isoform X4 [Danio rerio]|uniref:Inositol 1,4,5-triphosphate receptor associated 1 isoform X4 n=2 Tax=Danio rerio TaxID=7955 RepID=A0AC58G1J6_DANRE
MASANSAGHQSHLDDVGPGISSFVSCDHDCHECSVPSLSTDSGTYSVDPCHLLENSEDFSSENRDLSDCADTNGLSEEELLNITFEACDTSGKGEVRVSTVIQYLQAMTLQSSGQDKITSLRHMLDPEKQDSPVSRDEFHATMREWIRKCCQDGASVDKNNTTESALRKSPIMGTERHLPLTEATYTDGDECSEPADLSGLVAELKHTQRRLKEQNSSLMRNVSQCEDTILTLSLEVSELHTKLASAQLYVVRARSLSEELDECRCALRESQERAARAHASNCTLIKDCEQLKALFRITEEKNEKLTLEKNLAEDRLNKLRKENSELRGELEESHLVLAVKDLELTKKCILLEKLRDTHFESHKVIEGLQSELMRLQEHSQQALFRLNKYHISSCGPHRTGLTNHQSLHQEIQEAQPDKVGNCASEKCLQDQQQHGSSRQELVTLLKELELLESPHGLHKAQHQTQEAHIAAAITWWRGQGKDGKINQTVQDPQEAVRDMQKRLQILEVERTRVILKDQGTSTSEDPLIQFRDVAMVTDSSEEHLAAGDMLKSLRKVEDMVTEVLRAAQVLMGCEKKMKERIKAISMRMERALSRGEATESQITLLENAQSLCKSQTIATGVLVDYSSPVVTTFSTPELVTQENTREHSISSQKGVSLLYTGATEDHSNKVNNTHHSTFKDPDPGSPSEFLLKRVSGVCFEPLFTGLPSVGVIIPPGHSSLYTQISLPEPSACEEPTPHNRQENVAGSDQPTSNDSFLSESGDTGSTLAANKETCTSLNKGDAGCPGTELQNSRRKTETSERCQNYSGRTEALKLLKQGKLSKFADDWDNQGFSSPREALVEDSGICQEERQESDCSGRSREESEHRGKSQARTKNSEAQEKHKTSDSDTLIRIQATGLADNLEGQQDPPPVCQFTHSRGEQTSLKSAPSFVTESVASFVFPHTRSRPPLTPAMPTLPEEEEDSPEELDSTSSSPSTYAPVESKMVSVNVSPPAIVLQRQVIKQESCPLEKARPHSPRPRLSRNSPSSCPITTVDGDGHVIDLVKDQLPDLKLSEEDRQKNLELLEEAKKVSDRFLQRRGRRSTCSLTESPTALSPNPTPSSSPRPSRSSSLSSPSALGPEVSQTPPASPSLTQHLEVPSNHDQGDTSKPEQETFSRLVEWMPSDKRKVSSGTLTPRYTTAIPAREPSALQKDRPEHHGPAEKGKNSEHAGQKKEESPSRGITQPLATGVAKPVPRPPTQQAPCTAEIKTIGAFPPLMRAVSWDIVGSMNMRNAAPKGEDGPSFPDKQRESLFMSSGYKDFPVPPGGVQKLSKLREEHKLVRNQSISSSKLPDLNEIAEQERGPPSPLISSPSEEETKEKPDAMPNISDVMLRKLKLHRGSTGCAPPLSEKEVENAFVQLSLAFRNDNYTLESRQKQAERERNLTEENLEKELEEFKVTLKSTVSLWQNVEQREFYQNLLETIAVLHRLTIRLSSRAEMVGAVRQEKRMNKATEVMMQYVENLKRTYEKDHAELMEFKKLANQNSNRCYGGSMDTGDEGVPRSSRSMSMQMGKALPRRRVSVAVVPKFNLLNIPGQTPAAGPNITPGALPVVCEANTIKNGSSSDPTQQDVPDKPGNPLTEQESEATPTKVVCSPEKVTEEIKAKIEEEAYNKGYLEGLKKCKELQELKEEEEKQKECDEEARANADKDRKTNRFEEALEVLDRIFPKFFRRNRVLWIVLTLFFASFIIVNVINMLSSRYSDSGDTSAEKSAIPGKKKFFGLNVGSKAPAPE